MLWFPCPSQKIPTLHKAEAGFLVTVTASSTSSSIANSTSDFHSLSPISLIGQTQRCCVILSTLARCEAKASSDN
jgi:hypothetical protein